MQRAITFPERKTALSCTTKLIKWTLLITQNCRSVWKIRTPFSEISCTCLQIKRRPGPKSKVFVLNITTFYKLGVHYFNIHRLICNPSINIIEKQSAELCSVVNNSDIKEAEIDKCSGPFPPLNILVSKWTVKALYTHTLYLSHIHTEMVLTWSATYCQL